ncbi:MAG: AsmA family protein [Porticoccaceae bacterium]
MSKAIKIIAASALIAVLAMVALLSYVILAIDPNDYKPRIEDAARAQGVELDIVGKVGWSFFPSIAIQLGETRFESELHGINPSSLEQMNLALGWWELLQRRLAVKAMAINGADLHLARSDSAAAIATVPATGSEPLTSDDGRGLALAVDQFTVANSRLRLEQDGETIVIDNIRLDVSDASLDGDPFPVGADFDYRSGDGALGFGLTALLGFDQQSGKLLINNALLNITGFLPQAVKVLVSADIDTHQQQARITSLTASVGKTRLEGRATFNNTPPRSLDINLKGNQLDTSDLLAATAAGADTDAGQDSEPVPAENDASLLAPLLAPLALLDGGKGRIELAMEKVVHDGIELGSPHLVLDIADNQLHVRELTAEIFGGALATSGTVDARAATPRLSFDQQLTAIDLGAALSALAQDVDVTGTLNLSIKGESSGADADTLLANLGARGNLSVENPVLAAFNIEKSYCELAALVEKNPPRQTPWPAGTQLNSLTSQLRIADGILYLDDYSTGMGNLKLRGSGEVDLVKQRFDILAITRLEGDHTSADGCAVKSKRVRDKDIPLRCQDTFATAGAGSCKPDPAFVNNLLQDEVIDKLRDKTNLDDDKADAIEGLLRGFLGGKKGND